MRWLACGRCRGKAMNAFTGPYVLREQQLSSRAGQGRTGRTRRCNWMAACSRIVGKSHIQMPQGVFHRVIYLCVVELPCSAHTATASQAAVIVSGRCIAGRRITFLWLDQLGPVISYGEGPGPRERLGMPTG